MKRGKSVLNMSHEDWLIERRQGIGGSDASCIVGVNPWRSIVNVYLDKIGEAPLEIADNERMRIGRDLEDYVARRFEEKTGKKVRRNNFMLHHDTKPYLFADVDREVVGENAILECKTTNSYAIKDWETEPPVHYQMQCLHYMLVTNCDRVYIAALIGNEAFVYYTIERDEETIEALKKLEVDFWENNVLARNCPPPDGSSDLSKILVQKYPFDNGDEVQLQKCSEQMIAHYDELDNAIKKMSTEKEKIKQLIQSEMGEAAVAYVGDKKITWKTQSRTSLDSKRLKEELPEVYNDYAKTTTTRAFKIKK